MAWLYAQRTGVLFDAAGNVVTEAGYSGGGIGKNNPAAQTIHDVGPIPRGQWRILAPIDTLMHGPYALPLQAAPDTETYGRAGFLIHGDSKVHPGAASEGCIVLPRAIREHVWNSGDHDLTVIAS